MTERAPIPVLISALFALLAGCTERPDDGAPSAPAAASSSNAIAAPAPAAAAPAARPANAPAANAGVPLPVLSPTGSSYGDARAKILAGQHYVFALEASRGPTLVQARGKTNGAVFEFEATDSAQGASAKPQHYLSSRGAHYVRMDAVNFTEHMGPPMPYALLSALIAELPQDAPKGGESAFVGSISTVAYTVQLPQGVLVLRVDEAKREPVALEFTRGSAAVADTSLPLARAGIGEFAKVSLRFSSLRTQQTVPALPSRPRWG